MVPLTTVRTGSGAGAPPRRLLLLNGSRFFLLCLRFAFVVLDEARRRGLGRLLLFLPELFGGFLGSGKTSLLTVVAGFIEQTIWTRSSPRNSRFSS